MNIDIESWLLSSIYNARLSYMSFTGLVHIFSVVLIFLLTATSCSAASFDCANADGKVERRICANSEISRLDEKLGSNYRKAMESVANADALKTEQLKWLKSRNGCDNDDCLTKAYKSRLAELSYYLSAPFDAKKWVEARRDEIERILAAKKLSIPKGFPSDTPFCHQLMTDLKTLGGMEIIAPEVIANGLHAPAVQKKIFDRCPDLYRGNALEQPRKIVLYHADLNNNPNDGKEWLLGDHYVKRISPPWGDELLVNNRYMLIDVNDCKESKGVAYVGGSQRYAPDTKPEGLALDTGVHGVMRYRGKYYIYDVIDEPKVPPFGLQEFVPGKTSTNTICSIKEQRN